MLQETGATIFTVLMCFDLAVLLLMMFVGTFDLEFRVEASSGETSEARFQSWADGHAFGDLVTLHTDEAERLFWYFCAVVSGLAALPFALLKVPGLGEIILRLRATGYNEAGGLHSVLPYKQVQTALLEENTTLGHSPVPPLECSGCRTRPLT